MAETILFESSFDGIVKRIKELVLKLWRDRRTPFTDDESTKSKIESILSIHRHSISISMWGNYNTASTMAYRRDYAAASTKNQAIHNSPKGGASLPHSTQGSAAP